MSTVLLERLGYRAALSLDCRDAVTDTPVTDLIAWAWPSGDPERRLTARRSPTSSLLGFGVLPHRPLDQYAHSADGGPLPWPAAEARAYRVLVTDPGRRYLPVLTTVTVPVTAPTRIGLHTAPTFPPRSGFAVVRGQVLRTSTAAPLGWAVVTATLAGQPYQARCDQAGVFLLSAPYPEALPPLGQPASGTGRATMAWNAAIAVASNPDALLFHPPVPGFPGLDQVPDLQSVLSQSPAVIDGDDAATLVFGEPLSLSLSAEPT